MKNLVSRFAKCESGATAIEYGLIATLIGVAIIGVVSTTGGDTLEFTSARIERRPPGSSDCLDGGPGFVVLSSAPALRAETVRPLRGRTLLFALLVMPFLGALIISPM